MIPIIYCARFRPFLNKKKHSRISRKCLKLLVRPAGFEPAAYGFEVRRSIQLSYGRICRIEPAQFCVIGYVFVIGKNVFLNSFRINVI